MSVVRGVCRSCITQLGRVRTSPLKFCTNVWLRERERDGCVNRNAKRQRREKGVESYKPAFTLYGHIHTTWSGPSIYSIWTDKMYLEWRTALPLFIAVHILLACMTYITQTCSSHVSMIWKQLFQHFIYKKINLKIKSLSTHSLLVELAIFGLQVQKFHFRWIVVDSRI